jgi:hypothetical protein
MIIDNNLRTIFVTPDNLLREYTKLSSNVTSGATSLEVANTSGFDTAENVYIGEIGNDKSEITAVTSLGDGVINCGALKLSHENRDKVYFLEYDQINLYKNDTLVATVGVKADYYTRFEEEVDKDANYYITFENSTGESENREEINGYERNLCSVGDIYGYERPDSISFKLISKIDIASREIRSLFISQDQLFTDLSDNQVELLRQPTALLALYYSWNELIKAPDDISSLKASNYKLMYDAKIKEILDVISKKNSNISMFGQARFER